MADVEPALKDDSTVRNRWGRATRASTKSEVSANDMLEGDTKEEAAPQPALASEKRSWRGCRSRLDPDKLASEVPVAALPLAIDSVPALTREGPARPGLGCTIRLRRGIQMPQMGLGGGGLEGSEGRHAIASALQAGYRLIDTALYYRTENDIAQGIRLAGLERSDVFISTKLLQKAHVSSEQVLASLKESLRNLGTDYVDLYLIHNPRAGRIKEVWALLLQLRDQGLARAVGVSNFGVGQLEGLREAGLELPEVNQIEVHCWRQLPEVVAYHQRHGIATMCMAPLARGRMFGRSDLAAVAQELGRSEAEVAIRWSLQRGYIPIPKSISPERILLNTADGFDLSKKYMARIEKLDSGFMSCTMASPCHKLDWKLVADSIPHPDTWGGGRNKGKGSAGKDSGKPKGGEHHGYEDWVRGSHAM